MLNMNIRKGKFDLCFVVVLKMQGRCEILGQHFVSSVYHYV